MMKAPAEITPRVVRALFRDVLRGSECVPSPSPCRDVALWLGFVRLRHAGPARVRPGASRAGNRSVSAVLAELTMLERRYAQFPGSIARVPTLPFLEEVIRERSRVADDIRVCREKLTRLRPLLESPVRPPPAWHAEAEGLARAFRSAMARANPGRRFEPSNGGPLVRFISAALALAVGEKHTEAAIAQHLKRRRRKAKQAAGPATPRDSAAAAGGPDFASSSPLLPLLRYLHAHRDDEL
ncbi:MAG: hypothetical protein ACREFZ_01675 [Acetobacteraceae bacterium]